MGLQFSITRPLAVRASRVRIMRWVRRGGHAFTSAMRIKMFSFVRWRAWGWLYGCSFSGQYGGAGKA